MKKAAEAAREKAAGVVDAMEQAVEDSVDRITDAVDAAVRRLGAAVHNAESAVAAAAEDVQVKVGDVTERVSTAAADVADRVNAAVENATGLKLPSVNDILNGPVASGHPHTQSASSATPQPSGQRRVAGAASLSSDGTIGGNPGWRAAAESGDGTIAAHPSWGIGVNGAMVNPMRDDAPINASAVVGPTQPAPEGARERNVLSSPDSDAL
jgi:uncharacterized alkaline shock family protein YloU